MQATVNRLAHLLPDLFMLDMCLYGASQVALVVKNLPANAGDLRDMGLIPESEDPLEEGKAAHSSILAWRTMHRIAWQATVRCRGPALVDPG